MPSKEVLIRAEHSQLPDPPWGKVRIGAVDWEVKPDEHSREHGEFASTNHRVHTIFLDPNLGHWHSRTAAVHELFHATSMALSPGGHDDELTEQQIISLTTVLVSMLRDNPEWAAWLVKQEADAKRPQP